MRRFRFTILLSIGFLTHGYSQEITISSDVSGDYEEFAYSLRDYNEITTDSAYFRIFELGLTISVHPDIVGQDIVRYDLLIAMRHRGVPGGCRSDWKSFWIYGEFIDPRNYEFDVNLKILSFDYGTSSKIGQLKLQISCDSIDKL